MKSMERIQATLSGKPIDRRAFMAVLSLYGARLTGCSIEQHYTDPVAYTRGQAEVLKTFHPDVLFAPFNFPLIGAAFGSELHFFAKDAPNISRPAIRSVEEWDELVLPDPDHQPQLLFIRDAIKQMADEHRGQVPIAVVIPTPADLPELVMGLDAWLETVLFDVAGAQRVMERIVPFFVDLVNKFFLDGADFVVLPCGFASPTIVTRKIVTDFTRPVMAKALAQLRGPVILHNVGAPILAHLDLLVGLPSVAGFVLDQRDNLGQARRVVGPDPVLIGGLDCANVARMTPVEVEAKCRAILEDCRQDPHFILGISGPDVPWDTSPESIHAMRIAAESFGGAL